MKISGVTQVSVLVLPEAEEPVSALFERVFGAFPASYTDVEKRQCVVSVYLYGPLASVRPKIPDLQRGLAELRDLGLQTGPGEIRIRSVPREDWSESWKKFFKTIVIGSALMIKPSWSKQKPVPGQAVVVLDPGLSFGTGQHATTSFCLKHIAALRPKPGSSRHLSLLDIGCGSGILAIAAAKLGYAPIRAFDFDPVAVRVARKNCRANRVETKIAVSRQNLQRIPLQGRIQYDVVCANLMADLLISERDRIVGRLAPRGTLLLAGILRSEFSGVERAFEEIGLSLRKSRREREWQSGLFRFKH